MKKILISQPAPSSDKSPFSELTSKHKVEIDFRPFITIEGVSVKDFRAQRVDIAAHSAIIFTSRKTIDHFFRICEQTRTVVSDELKYFCVTEAIALYLQKYIVYRKRKIFFGTGTFFDLLDLMSKHKTEKYMMALSEPHKPEIPQSLTRAGFKYSKLILTHAMPANLSDIDLGQYDIVACYSPADIKTLKENFKEIPASVTIATLGTATAREAMLAKLRVDIMAPTAKFPSLTMAIDKYIAAAEAGEPLDEFALTVIPEAQSYKKVSDRSKKSAKSATTKGTTSAAKGAASKSAASSKSATKKTVTPAPKATSIKTGKTTAKSSAAAIKTDPSTTSK